MRGRPFPVPAVTPRSLALVQYGQKNCCDLSTDTELNGELCKAVFHLISKGLVFQCKIIRGLCVISSKGGLATFSSCS